MNATRELSRPLLELVDARPNVSVAENEYRRLLGYPNGHAPGDRATELADWARRTYAEIGRPWIYLREVEVQFSAGSLWLDGTEFSSPQLRDYFAVAGAQRAMLVAVSAGQACEEKARKLWQESKPDEYFFLEVFGSAVVENLVASANARLCSLADREHLIALPHYSPGYSGWDVAEQSQLFALIARGQMRPFPEPLEVLTSGMLQPKKSLLAVVGLAPRHPGRSSTPRGVPCEACSFSPCSYRRAPYRHAPRSAIPAAMSRPPLTPNATYTVNPRALRKWVQERVRVTPLADGSVSASFRFDGTTCSNMGRPLAFDYSVNLSAPADGYRILEADCRPAANDDGYESMCSYLSDPHGLMEAIADEKPLLGRPLNDVLTWKREPAPTGCYCDATSRAHKWGLALEAIHFALAQNQPSSPSANQSGLSSNR